MEKKAHNKAIQTHHVVQPMETSAILISILYERVILHALAYFHVNGSSPIPCIIILESSLFVCWGGQVESGVINQTKLCACTACSADACSPVWQHRACMAVGCKIVRLYTCVGCQLTEWNMRWDRRSRIWSFRVQVNFQ